MKQDRAPYTALEIAAAWQDALAVWDVAVNLSPPEPLEKRPASHWPGGEPLAFIDLATRQVVVNLELLVAVGARASLTAVLAHELGHHVRFPHTLGLAAHLELLQQRLLPRSPSLTNLFFDLQVNELVGRARAGELAAVYRGFNARVQGELAPVFAFYMAIYEELWGAQVGALAPKATYAALEARYPGARAEARLFAQTFWSLNDTYLQFVYFCSRFGRYVADAAPPEGQRMPMGGDVGTPDLDDYDGAMQGADAIDEALAEAAARGWLDSAGAPDAATPGQDVFRRLGGMPGHAQAQFKPALVERHYRRLVDAHLVELPGTQPPPEPTLPTVLEDWQAGDDLRAIDWTASVLARGALAAVAPLRRDLDPDEPAPPGLDIPAVEIYLDTSGSMPAPDRAENAMTLAALVLATAAARRKGTVRGVVYSSGTPLLSPWMYDEELARRFLLQYAGGGTDYPFALMAKLASQRDDVLRVVVSDGDFLSNVQGKGAMDLLHEGVRRSRAFVTLLHLGGAQVEQARKLLAPVLGHPRFRLVPVADTRALATMARQLADALLGTVGDDANAAVRGR